MQESRDELIQTLKLRLATIVDVDVIGDIINIVTYELNNYDVTKKTTEIIPYADDNERVLKSFLACLVVEGKSKGTIYQYKRSLIRLFTFLGNKRYDEITTYDIRAWLASIKLTNKKNTHIRNQKCNITPFFTWLYNDGLIDKNPCNPIKPIKVLQEEKSAFTSEDIDTIRSNCKTPFERAVIEFLLSSGIRVMELCNLKLEDVDFEKMTVFVRCGKGGKDRTTFINPVAKKYVSLYLKDCKHKSDYVFTTKFNGKYSTCSIRRITTAISDRSGIHVHPHRFRRTLATDLARKGMEIQEIQKLLGHSNIETTRKYIETTTEKVEASYRQFLA